MASPSAKLEVAIIRLNTVVRELQEELSATRAERKELGKLLVLFREKYSRSGYLQKANIKIEHLRQQVKELERALRI